MADDADRADERIQRTIDDGRARAKLAMDNPSLRPIVLEIDGTRFGVCHYCESEIRPGHLFCPTDKEEPQYSCAVMDEQKRKRDKASGL